MGMGAAWQQALQEHSDSVYVEPVSLLLQVAGDWTRSEVVALQKVVLEALVSVLAVVVDSGLQ